MYTCMLVNVYNQREVIPKLFTYVNFSNTKTHKHINKLCVLCFQKTHNQKHKHIINLTNYVFLCFKNT